MYTKHTALLGALGLAAELSGIKSFDEGVGARHPLLASGWTPKTKEQRRAEQEKKFGKGLSQRARDKKSKRKNRS